MRRPLVAIAIAACFFVSGAAGLLYQVVWMRLLSLALGHTVHAVTTVLVAFMGGLALGSFWGGRAADRLARPLRAYGAIEAAVGLYCLATPLLLRVVGNACLELDRSLGHRPLLFASLQLGLTLVVLLPATVLMGATLPILGRFVVDAPERAGSRVGMLYAINTWGAVAGAAMAGFVLLPAIGLRATVALGAALNIGVALLALAADRSPETAQVVKPPDGEPAPPPLGRRLLPIALAGIGISGAASMAYEIAWTRALSLVVGSSTYAFSAMLVTFLVGLALGSLLVARALRRFQLGLGAFAAFEAAIGFAALLLLPVLGRLPELTLWILRRGELSHRGALLSQFTASFCVMILPTLLLGATLPCIVQAVSRGLGRVGRDVGTVYAVNTVGTIVGAAAAGFILIPALGIQRSVTAAAAANVAVAVLAWALMPRARVAHRVAAGVAAITFAVAAYGLPSWDRQVMASGVSVYAGQFAKNERGGASSDLREGLKTHRLLFYAEGANTTVSVEQGPRNRSIHVNGKADASNGPDMLTQLMLGHLPAFLRTEARHALVIGFGSGVTAGALAAHPLDAIDVAELEPEVIQASEFFVTENRNVLRDPRVRVLLGDGRHILAAATHPYDLIVAEPSNPWIAGVGNLFTRDFYQLARSHLSDDGVMVAWIHGYSLFPGELRMVVRTFQEVFPHTSIWRGMTGDYLMVGTTRRLAVDTAALMRRVDESPAVAQVFSAFRWQTPVPLLYRFLLDEDDVRRYAGDAPLNTDDRPLLEFAAPLALYAASDAENDSLLRSYRRSDLPPLDGAPAALMTDAASRLAAARIHWAMGETRDALEQLGHIAQDSTTPAAVRMDRARLFFVLGGIDEGVAAFEALAREMPGDPVVASYLRAAPVLRQIDLRSMMVVTGRAAQTRWNLAEAYDNLGNFFVRTGVRSGEPAFFALAIDQFEAALAFEPSAHEIVNNLGNAYFELGRIEEAVAAYRRVLALQPARAEAHFNLGLTLERSGQRDEAARAYREASRLAPAWVLPQQQLSRLLAGSGNP